MEVSIESSHGDGVTFYYEQNILSRGGEYKENEKMRGIEL